MSRFRNYKDQPPVRRRRSRRSSKWKMRILIALLLAILIGGYFFGRAALVWDRPNSDSDARVSLTIKPGSSLTTIAEQLSNNELIRDAGVWKWFVKSKGLGNKLQAGDYVIQRNLTFAEITEVLMNGKSEEVRITIPEGYTIKQIDGLLAKKNLVEVGDFEDCTNTCDLGFRVESLEGYLFPSTYYENIQNFSARSFITRLYNTWQQQIKPFKADIPGNRTIEQTMIVASMIEREAFGDSFEEKQMISDVIWKRLDEGIALGIDATTRYAKNDWENPLYTQDFNENNPYDTRRRIGLTPTAISNPGLDSIKAAIYPTETEYYYYLHDNTGQVHFGRNLEEHNQNKYKYLR